MITLLSLIVGGIGIMNIMFVSVKERTERLVLERLLSYKRNDYESFLWSQLQYVLLLTSWPLLVYF